MRHDVWVADKGSLVQGFERPVDSIRMLDQVARHVCVCTPLPHNRPLVSGLNSNGASYPGAGRVLASVLTLSGSLPLECCDVIVWWMLLIPKAECWTSYPGSAATLITVAWRSLLDVALVA